MCVKPFIQEWKALWRGDPPLPHDGPAPQRPKADPRDVLVEHAVKPGAAPSEDGGAVAGRGSGTGTALDTLRQRLAKPEDLTLQRTGEGLRACFVWRQP